MFAENNTVIHRSVPSRDIIEFRKKWQKCVQERERKETRVLHDPIFLAQFAWGEKKYAPSAMICHDGFSNLHLFKQINIYLIFTGGILYLLHRGCTSFYTRDPTFSATRRIVWQIIISRGHGEGTKEGDGSGPSINRIINQIQKDRTRNEFSHYRNVMISSVNSNYILTIVVINIIIIIIIIDNNISFIRERGVTLTQRATRNNGSKNSSNRSITYEVRTVRNMNRCVNRVHLFILVLLCPLPLNTFTALTAARSSDYI